MPNQHSPVPIERMQARGMNGKTLGGRDIVATEVDRRAPAPVPAAPGELSERGVREWTAIWSAGHWLWPDQDYHWVEQACRAYDLIDLFTAQIKKDGTMVPGYRPGMMVANPLYVEINRQQQVIQKCLSTLGFSPTDRARLKLTELKSERISADLVPKAANIVQSSVDYDEGSW